MWNYMYIRKLARSSLRWMPTSWKACLEFCLDTSIGSEFGGPFNGQTVRRRIFLELLRAIPFRAIVETGTFRGSTTSLLAEQSGLPVYSVEATPRFFYYARLRLRRHRRVHITLGDSRQFLKGLSEADEIPKENTFFYLDAHWNEDLPLREEVELITRYWRRSVIMIDDFEVPGDKGYTYDDYGQGKRLCLDYLGSLSQFNLIAFFPSAPSDEENGLKRGCVVLVDQAWLDKVKELSSLRLYKPSSSSELDAAL